jgi:osmotically-inducible protein OsmY
MKEVTSNRGIIVCLLFTVVIIGCASSRTRESTGEFIDDSTITTKVKAALLAEPGIKSYQIGVETFKGIVQLSGFVDTQQQKLRAADIAWSVDGVKSVENNIIIKQQQPYY